MRSNFGAHFQKGSGELKSLWLKALFIFDANTLLNLYRYSEQARNEFLGVLRKLDSQIWIPNQAALEFFNCRLSEISAQHQTYKETLKDIERLKSSLTRDRGHPFISSALMAQLDKCLTDVVVELNKNSESLSAMTQLDPILESVATMFEGKVGRKWAPEEIEKVFALGQTRYSERIPPGYMDNRKAQNPSSQAEKASVYGDLIVWMQSIEEAKARKCPVVFITDDRKEDWWLEALGKTIGPRPELTAEFQAEVGQEFHMYRPEQFLIHSKEIKHNVSAKTIEEVKEVDAARGIVEREKVGRFRWARSEQDVESRTNLFDFEKDRMWSKHFTDLYGSESRPFSGKIDSAHLDEITLRNRSNLMSAKSRVEALSSEINDLELRLHKGGPLSDGEEKELMERLGYLRSDIRKAQASLEILQQEQKGLIRELVARRRFEQD